MNVDKLTPDHRGRGLQVAMNTVGRLPGRPLKGTHRAKSVTHRAIIPAPPGRRGEHRDGLLSRRRLFEYHACAFQSLGVRIKRRQTVDRPWQRMWEIDGTVRSHRIA